ncbi:MAG: peptidylprolyl isomerase [Pseudolabrys sp.]
MPRVCLKFSLVRRLLACAAVAMALAAPTLAVPTVASAQVVVIANGLPVTELDIKQRERLIANSTHKHVTRQEVINQLIDDRLKIAKAKTYGLVISDREVNAAFDNMAKRQGVSPKQFETFLNRAGVTPYAVKQRLRAQLAWNQMVRGKYASQLKVTDADVEGALRARHQGATLIGYAFTLYPVTVVVPQGSSRAVVAQKRRQAEDLRSRFTNCAQGLQLARGMGDVAVREPITRYSAQLPKPFRDLLDKMPVGHLTSPDVTAQGLQMFALCQKKQTTQDSPEKAKVRNEIFQKRFKAAASSFLEEIRRQAWIEYKHPQK